MLPSKPDTHAHESNRPPRLKRPFRAIGILFIAAAFAIFTLGIWTFSFESVSGRLLELHHERSMVSGDYPGIPFVGSRHKGVPSISVSYRYQVDETRYESSRVGMGFRPWSLSPFSLMDWERDIETDPANLNVWHSPAIPGISVLHRGPDWVVTIAFAIVGLAFLTFSNWISRHTGA
jgi:hypothetical protein